LKEANYSNGNYYRYTYDAVGNRKTQTTFIGGLTSTTTYNYDHANRLTDVNGVSYEYDFNGNTSTSSVQACSMMGSTPIPEFTLSLPKGFRQSLENTQWTGE